MGRADEMDKRGPWKKGDIVESGDGGGEFEILDDGEHITSYPPCFWLYQIKWIKDCTTTKIFPMNNDKVVRTTPLQVANDKTRSQREEIDKLRAENERLKAKCAELDAKIVRIGSV